MFPQNRYVVFQRPIYIILRYYIIGLQLID